MTQNKRPNQGSGCTFCWFGFPGLIIKSKRQFVTALGISASDRLVKATFPRE